MLGGIRLRHRLAELSYDVGTALVHVRKVVRAVTRQDATLNLDNGAVAVQQVLL
jgi:hypothetical protein